LHGQEVHHAIRLKSLWKREKRVIQNRGNLDERANQKRQNMRNIATHCVRILQSRSIFEVVLSTCYNIMAFYFRVRSLTGFCRPSICTGLRTSLHWKESNH
jgi:hypothetical protein